MSYTDRARAGSFGDDAALYDRARPTYPEALIDDLVIRDGARSAVDVGCGTGIVSRLLAERGCKVIGVEADARMADVARGHGLEVEVSKFEEWDAGGRTFDLLTSGQAWHWVEPEAGLRKAAEVLRPGGRLALFWNGLTLPQEVLEAITPVYRRLAPAELDGSVALGTAKPGGARDDDTVIASGLFTDVEHRAYEWQRETTVADWIESLPTHSGHRLLGERVLGPLLDEVRSVLAPIDRPITIAYCTAGVFARSR